MNQGRSTEKSTQSLPFETVPYTNNNGVFNELMNKWRVSEKLSYDQYEYEEIALPSMNMENLLQTNNHFKEVSLVCIKDNPLYYQYRKADYSRVVKQIYSKCHQLAELNLRNLVVYDNVFKLILNSKSIKSLTFDQVEIPLLDSEPEYGSTDFYSLHLDKSLQCLESIRLRWFRPDMWEDLHSWIVDLKHMTIRDPGRYTDCHDITTIKKIISLCKETLQSITLTDTCLVECHFKVLTQCINLVELKTKYSSGNPLEIMESLATLNPLKYLFLDLRDTPVLRLDYDQLFEYPVMSELLEVTLSGHNISFNTLINLAKVAQKLYYLDLNECLFPIDRLHHLLQLTRNLKYLRIHKKSNIELSSIQNIFDMFPHIEFEFDFCKSSNSSMVFFKSNTGKHPNHARSISNHCRSYNGKHAFRTTFSDTFVQSKIEKPRPPYLETSC